MRDDVWSVFGHWARGFGIRTAEGESPTSARPTQTWLLGASLQHRFHGTAQSQELQATEQTREKGGMSRLKRLTDMVALPIFQRMRPLRQFVTYVSRQIDQDSYDRLRRRFIRNGEGTRWNEAIRASIVDRFETIDREVPIGTTPTDGLFLAEALLSLEAEGAVVECGSYAGGSTTKLSIVADLVGRGLSVFDSFEGLPEVDEHNIRDYHARRSSEWVTDWTAGRYAARLEQVRSNVERHGEIAVCTFHRGWFSDTLTKGNLPGEVCFAFVDVDIASSAQECLVAIWPLLSAGGVYFSHDVAYIKVLQAMLGEGLWRDVFKEHPPILLGAGYGLGDSSPHLGFMVKGNSIAAGYINSLTIDK